VHASELTIEQDTQSSAQEKWTCALCNVSFTLRKNLKAHEKTSRSHLAKLGHSTSPDGSMKCSLCSISFSKKSGLKRHLNAQHGICHEDENGDSFGSRRVKKTNAVDSSSDVKSPGAPLTQLSTVLNNDLASRRTPQGKLDLESTISPKLLSAHDILIFMPAYGDSTRRTKGSTQVSTCTDRNCFALVILGVALTKAVGPHGNVKMLVSSSMPLSDFVDAASHLELSNDFTRISTNLLTFTNEEDMVDEFKKFAKLSTSSRLKSLFVYGHGDATRTKIIFNGLSTHLSGGQLANMISTCCCNIAHIMTCKASNLIT